LQRVSGGPGCSEGLATFEGGIYFDLLLRDELDALAQRASRVVMFNDSCFSGGAATKSFDEAGPGESVPKVYPISDVKSLAFIGVNDVVDARQVCGVHVNSISKAFGGLAQSQRGVLYVAAAAANEAAFPTPQGSVGTRAWAACLQDPAADSDVNGFLSGAELLTCANAWVQSNSRYRQTITLIGNGQVPLRRF
jgi:hypothetical protein